MKLIKTASGKQKLKLSKKEWQSIGKKAGWLDNTIEFGEGFQEGLNSTRQGLLGMLKNIRNMRKDEFEKLVPSIKQNEFDELVKAPDLTPEQKTIVEQEQKRRETGVNPSNSPVTAPSSSIPMPKAPPTTIPMPGRS